MIITVSIVLELGLVTSSYRTQPVNYGRRRACLSLRQPAENGEAV